MAERQRRHPEGSSIIAPSAILTIAPYGIPVVAAFILLGELGVPLGVPAEAVLLLAGSHLIDSPSALVLGIMVVVAADALGGLGLFCLVRFGGRRLGRWLRHRLAHRQPEAERQLPLRRRAIFAVRCLPLVRVYAVVGSALTGVAPKEFVAAALPASVVWVAIPMTLGYVLRDRVEALADGTSRGLAALAVASAVAGSAMIAVQLRARSGPRARGVDTGTIVRSVMPAPRGQLRLAPSPIRACGAPKIGAPSTGTAAYRRLA